MSSFLCSEERGELPASCCSTARPPSAPNRLNPYAEHMYDGIDLSPFEIMFVKLKEFLLEANWTTATQGKKYSLWSLHQVCVRAGFVGRHAPVCRPRRRGRDGGRSGGKERRSHCWDQGVDRLGKRG